MGLGGIGNIGESRSPYDFNAGKVRGNAPLRMPDDEIKNKAQDLLKLTLEACNSQFPPSKELIDEIKKLATNGFVTDIQQSTLPEPLKKTLMEGVRNITQNIGYFANNVSDSLLAATGFFSFIDGVANLEAASHLIANPQITGATANAYVNFTKFEFLGSTEVKLLEKQCEGRIYGKKCLEYVLDHFKDIAANHLYKDLDQLRDKLIPSDKVDEFSNLVDQLMEIPADKDHLDDFFNIQSKAYNMLRPYFPSL